MHNIDQILGRFPKRRPSLPPGQQAIYEQEYIANREGKNFMSSLAQKLESWMHIKVRANLVGERFLEVGAVTLNQVPYLAAQKKTYYDAVEPSDFLYKNSPFKNQIRFFFNDIEQCSAIYDTIFSVATLEHVTNLPYVLAKMGVLLEENGICVNAIPSEGGILWGISWRLSTGLAYKVRTSFSYANVMRHEHVNNHDEIIALHKYFFERVELSYFPLPGKHLSFYCCIVASHPNPDRCRHYLEHAQSL